MRHFRACSQLSQKGTEIEDTKIKWVARIPSNTLRALDGNSFTIAPEGQGRKFVPQGLNSPLRASKGLQSIPNGQPLCQLLFSVLFSVALFLLRISAEPKLRVFVVRVADRLRSLLRRLFSIVLIFQLATVAFFLSDLR